MWVHAKTLQLCLTLFNPLDYSMPSSSAHRILQTRIPKWVAMPSSRGASWPRDGTCVSYVSCFVRQDLCHECHVGSPQIWHTLTQWFWPGFVLSTYLYLPTITVLSTAATAAKSLQSCPTLCDPIDGSPPGSPVLGILQARTLEWVAISFSNSWNWKVKVKSLSHVWLLATPWTAGYQPPLSMGFSRQEY